MEVGLQQTSAITARNSSCKLRQEEGITKHREGITANISHFFKGTASMLPLLLLPSTASVLPLLLPLHTFFDPRISSRPPVFSTCSR